MRPGKKKRRTKNNPKGSACISLGPKTMNPDLAISAEEPYTEMVTAVKVVKATTADPVPRCV